ncbi:MAG: BON domain-containing protein [Candidatus Wallbacteria bacterium]|nr:BON domain-containing protein [Candidatus Wallbacteria bacterium]
MKSRQTRFRSADTDSRIESSFKQTYIYRTFLFDESISISSSEGVVTLSGHVLTPAHKLLALNTVRALPGVESVEYHIEVKDEPAHEYSDTWIGWKIKFTLLYHRSVSGFDTEVLVKDGIVTLKGLTGSESQKALTGEYALDIHGVTKVINEMSVAREMPAPDHRTSAQKIDDASITALVKGVLMYHRSTSLLKVYAETRDGAVTLTGISKNHTEKDMVTKLISDIHGLKSVSNNMTVSMDQAEAESS